MIGQSSSGIRNTFFLWPKIVLAIVRGFGLGEFENGDWEVIPILDMMDIQRLDMVVREEGFQRRESELFSRAMVKKVVVKQAKTDTSSSTEISILDTKETMIVMVQGACLGLLDKRGGLQGCSIEGSLHLHHLHDPGGPMEGVPCLYCIEIISQSFTRIWTSTAGDKSYHEESVGRTTLILQDLPEHRKHEKQGVQLWKSLVWWVARK